MTSAWKELPKEILEVIFKNLKVAYHKIDFDLKECALVCRGWATIAQELIFSSIYLKSEEEFDRLMYTVALNPNLARFVKAIKYHFKKSTSKKHISHLAIIANFFPQLEQLDSGGFVDNTFYELLCNLVREGKLLCFKVFPKTWNTYQEELRALCMISYGKSLITEIDLFRHDDTSRNDYRLLCDALPEFARLRKLSLTVISENTQNIIEYLESTTRSATLQEASYIFDFPDTSTLSQLNTVLPVSNMKSLTTQLWRKLGVDHADYILYLMKKFPGLERLKVVFHDQWCVGSLEHNAQERGSVDQIFKYLSRLLEYSISLIYTDGNNLDRLFKLFFHSIRDKIEVPIHLELGPGSSDDDTAEAFIKFTREKGQRTISLQLYTRDHDRIIYNFLENFGHHFKGLSLNRNSAVELTNDLNYISKYCANLQSLIIRGQSNVKYKDGNQTDYMIHKSLKKLTVQEFSSKLFPFIASRFPCIETVNIKCRYDPEDDAIRKYNRYRGSNDTEKSEDTKITRLNLKNFSFRHLVLEVSVNERNYDARLKNIYIKVVTSNDGKTRYIHILAPSMPDETYPKKRQVFELADNPTEVEYENTIGDLFYLHYEVKCEYIEKVSVIEFPINFDNLEIDVDILQI